MPILIFITLLGWIPLTIGLFVVLRPQRAVVASLAGGYLLLPPASIPISGLPDYDKMMAATVGILLGTLIFQPHRLLEFRLRWFDLPVLCWVIAPIISSMTNGYGLYDGLSASLGNIVRWVLAYFIGRLYLGDLEGLRELTLGIICGGLAYIPLILLEMRLSPFLKGAVYGMYKWEGLRYGSYRPFVFLTTGLELGMWMTGVSLTSLWMWRCGALKRIAGLPFGTLLLPVILVITVLCRSSGAFVLLLAGWSILWTCTRFNTKLPLLALLLISPTYYSLRMSGLWRGDNLVSFIQQLNADRAQSLEYRFSCENILIHRALEQPFFGWAGWGGSRVYESNGKNWVVTDGIWIIYLGNNGCFGLVAWTSMLLLPPWLFMVRFPVRQWKTDTVGPASVIATILGLYIIDCLLNGFINLLYILGSGALISVYPTESKRGLPIEGSSKGEGPRAPRSGSRWARSEVAELPAESSGSNNQETHTLSLPQAQLARRYQELARVLKSQGLPAEAKAAWIHALDILTEFAAKYPDLGEAQRYRWECANDLAWFLISQPGLNNDDSQLALRLATQTTQANPDIAAFWNTLGAAFYRTGSHSDAIAALERSIALSGEGTGFDFVFLSLVSAQLGQDEQARHWKTQADAWIGQHGSHRAEISRLYEQTCASTVVKCEGSAST